MKIEIWSDVVCPFCYIGKRRLEEALASMQLTEKVEIVWKSFQLDPDFVPEEKESPYVYLAKRKGVSIAESEHMHANVVEAARTVGLDYRFDKAIVANTFDAHRMSHLAKNHQLGEQFEERLFAAYFTEGKDLNEHETLIALAAETGIPEDESRDVLAGNRFADAVQADIQEAMAIGVRGVPFFVFDRRYAVSGAQPLEVFTETITEVLKIGQ